MPRTKRKRAHVKKRQPQGSSIAGKPRHFYGWVRDRPDPRDFIYMAPRKYLRALPVRVDLRRRCPPIYTAQRPLHSCTGNAIAAAIQFDQIKKKQPEIFAPSRLFIYYNARAMEHATRSDNGARIRHGLKSITRHGVCAEKLWPYRAKKFAKRPPQKCYIEGAKYRAVCYHRVRRTLKQMKACLASGYPFMFGFTVYESFHSKKVRQTGRASMPFRYEKIKGDHAVIAVGYDERQRRFIVRNSWGRKWGMRGYFTLPYEYFTNRRLSEDFWTIRTAN